jgi:uncharacterized protein involved in copper resistance
MKYKIILSILIIGLANSAFAQQKMNDTDKSKKNQKMAMPMNHGGHGKMKGMNMKDSSMNGMQMDGMKMDMMSSSQSKNLPMTRDGSGTSWLPDASPMYGIMLNSGKWSYMLH